jgi:hypothetical protein
MSSEVERTVERAGDDPVVVRTGWVMNRWRGPGTALAERSLHASDGRQRLLARHLIFPPQPDQPAGGQLGFVAALTRLLAAER